MQPRATTSCKHATRGFTLIEILVVIVIISVTAALVVLNFSPGGKEQQLREELTRLQQLLRFAHEQAVIRSEDYGVRFYQNGYRFMQYDALRDQWSKIEDDKLLRARTLDEFIQVELYIENASVDIPEDFDADPEEEEQESKEENDENQNTDDSKAATAIDTEKLQAIKPQVFLLSSSELTPAFEVEFRVPGSDIKSLLKGLPQGEYQLETDSE